MEDQRAPADGNVPLPGALLQAARSMQCDGWSPLEPGALSRSTTSTTAESHEPSAALFGASQCHAGQVEFLARRLRSHGASGYQQQIQDSSAGRCPSGASSLPASSSSRTVAGSSPCSALANLGYSSSGSPSLSQPAQQRPVRPVAGQRWPKVQNVGRLPAQEEAFRQPQSQPSSSSSQYMPQEVSTIPSTGGSKAPDLPAQDEVAAERKFCAMCGRHRQPQQRFCTVCGVAFVKVDMELAEHEEKCGLSQPESIWI